MVNTATDINKIPKILYNFSFVSFLDGFGMYVKLVLFESHIPIIPKTIDELTKFRKYLNSIRLFIGTVSGYNKYNILPCNSEYKIPQMRTMHINKRTLVVLFNFGFVTSTRFLYLLYHNLYPRYDTPKLTIAERNELVGLYPLIKSQMIFPTTAPIIPNGPNINPDINNIPT